MADQADRMKALLAEAVSLGASADVIARLDEIERKVDSLVALLGKSPPDGGDSPAAWTVDEWSEKTKISRSQVFRLLRDGRLTGTKVGARRLILNSPYEFLRGDEAA